MDLWLNTPQAPHGGVGHQRHEGGGQRRADRCRILDGWWIEGCIEGVTGWSIGGNQVAIESDDDRGADAASLYDKLETVILPLFYSDRDRYIDVMRHAIALNGRSSTRSAWWISTCARPTSLEGPRVPCRGRC